MYNVRRALCIHKISILVTGLKVEEVCAGVNRGDCSLEAVCEFDGVCRKYFVLFPFYIILFIQTGPHGLNLHVVGMLRFNSLT